MKILVAGHRGQVARALSECVLPDGFELVTSGRPEFDICDPVSIDRAIDRVKPSLVINAAAYTAVDNAEGDAETAYAVNHDAVRHLGSATAMRDIPLFHISTDYVFDGSKDAPYTEMDAVSPLGVYGQSKLAGEQAAAETNPAHVILRTAWVYSPFGKNFVKTMLRVANTRDELSVVEDQIGNPTSATDIAATLISIAEQYAKDASGLTPGIFHMSGSGEASWADFASEIFSVSKELGGPHATVKRITSAEYPTPVTRPANSRLDGRKLYETYGLKLPDWHHSARDCVSRLIESKDWMT